MITIQLDTTKEQQLRDLAQRLHQEPAEVARRIVEAHLDTAAWPEDSETDWAAASVALLPEVLKEEAWEEDGGVNEPG